MLKQGGTRLAILKCQSVRCVWNYETEQWYYSAVDIFGILTESVNPNRHWSDLKRGLKKLKIGFRGELYDSIVRFRMESKNGSKRSR